MYLYIKKITCICCLFYWHMYTGKQILLYSGVTITFRSQPTISRKLFSTAGGLRCFVSFFRTQTVFLPLSCRTSFSFTASAVEWECWHVPSSHFWCPCVRVNVLSACLHAIHFCWDWSRGRQRSPWFKIKGGWWGSIIQAYMIWRTCLE